MLLAINTANTKFLILEQLLCMALVMVSRTAEFNGNMRTEWVKKMNGLLDTEIKTVSAIRFVKLTAKKIFTFLVTFTTLQ